MSQPLRLFNIAAAKFLPDGTAVANPGTVSGVKIVTGGVLVRSLKFVAENTIFRPRGGLQ